MILRLIRPASGLGSSFGATLVDELVGHAGGHPLEDGMDALHNGASGNEHYGFPVYHRRMSGYGMQAFSMTSPRLEPSGSNVWPTAHAAPVSSRVTASNPP